MRDTRRPFVLGVLMACGLLLVYVAPHFSDQTAMQACVFVSLLATLAPVLTGRGWTSVGTVYLGFYWVFHFGIVAPIALGWTPKLFNSADSTWASPSNLASASLPAAIFAVSCSLAYTLTVRSDAASPDRAPQGPPEAVTLDGASVIGVLAVMAGLALWVQIYLSTGASLEGGYAQFLTRTQGTPTPYAYLLIAIGMGLIGAARNRTLSRIALLGFAIWSIPAFTLGLRGEVLIPALAFIIARSRSGRLHVSRGWVLVAGVAALSIGSLVRVARVGGTTDFSAANPINGLIELGYSIRPMVAVQQVHGVGGDVLFTGVGTYIAPVERLVVGRFLGNPVLPTSADPSVFSTFVSTNFGPIGGSVSAEAFRSGGVLGVLLAGVLIGAMIGRLDAAHSSVVQDAFVGMTSSVLLLWVRNDFTPVPLSLLLVMLVLAVTHLWPGRPRTSESRRGRMGRKQGAVGDRDPAFGGLPDHL